MGTSPIIVIVYILAENNQFYKHILLCYDADTNKKGVVPYDKHEEECRIPDRGPGGHGDHRLYMVSLLTGNITPVVRVTTMLCPVWFSADLALWCTIL